ncbi:MAG: signal recognition particle receptor subunit alpha, partial [Thaumarchaeota archaeon]|nr:signal recognition particle receptor subunit alpha [Nitrososphaerota archaeon]
MLEGIKKVFKDVAEGLKMRSLSEKEIQEYVEDFKLKLIMNDVAVEVAEKLGEELARKLKPLKLKRFGDSSKEILNQISAVIDPVLKEGNFKEFLEKIDEKRETGEPFTILFVGPNGSGKTTTIVKLALLLEKHGLKSVIAAADTFRAGAIEQLQKLAKQVRVRVVGQRYGADPAAVAMDAVMSAK